MHSHTMDPIAERFAILEDNKAKRRLLFGSNARGYSRLWADTEMPSDLLRADAFRADAFKAVERCER